MKQRFKQVLIGLAISLGIFAPLVPVTVHAAPADAKSAICEGLSTNSTNDCNTTTNNSSVERIMKLVLNMFSFVIGFAAVIMIIIGGFRYVISAGDGSNTAGAKNTILYAVIGLVVVAIAQIIVRFVLSEVVPTP